MTQNKWTQLIGFSLSSSSKARHSEYLSTKPRAPDLSALLASGEFPFLLRCCLDESGTGVQVAALNCLHGLLVSPPEEQLLDEQCSSFFGLSLPALSPRREGKVGTLAQKTDMEVMKKDVIKVGWGEGRGKKRGVLCRKSQEEQVTPFEYRDFYACNCCRGYATCWKSVSLPFQ